MSRKISTAIFAAGLLMFAQVAQPAFAQRRGGGGARAGAAQRGASRSYAGPRGGTAKTHSGPRGQAGTVTGPGGRTASGARGNYGGAAARGPEGGAAARGPYGGAAARTQSGQMYARNSYSYGGRSYYRPAWNSTQVNVYSRGFYGYPGWHPYGSYGLAPGLVAFSSLAFLSAGLLIGSYAQQNHTVYVYVVSEGGQNVEYRVDDEGKVLSKKVVQ